MHPIELRLVNEVGELARFNRSEGTTEESYGRIPVRHRYQTAALASSPDRINSFGNPSKKPPTPSPVSIFRTMRSEMRNASLPSTLVQVVLGCCVSVVRITVLLNQS